ncbi:MAG: rhomboid family intramembrane serine protease [Chloroflexia bacterium]|nr:rhomboid family intramembrane serine protease [Chloroflexia bacterium]
MTGTHTPSSHPLARFSPWTDGTGCPWRGWKRLPAMIPFVIGYILVAWIVFIPAAERRGRHYWIDDDAVGHLLFQVPDLTGDPPRAILSIVTGPWINHDSLQLMYVTALLLIFGAQFELREGTLRIVIVFFGTSFVAALFSGFLLHLIYPHVWDTRFFEIAWNRNWTGGSAGCFGLLGAFAARARKPGLLLALFVAWECFIWWVNLRNYTSVFHFSAMATGFLATRLFLPPLPREQR